MDATLEGSGGRVCLYYVMYVVFVPAVGCDIYCRGCVVWVMGVRVCFVGGL